MLSLSVSLSLVIFIVVISRTLALHEQSLVSTSQVFLSIAAADVAEVMVLNTELLNVPQGNNSQRIYSSVLYGDEKFQLSVKAMEMERERQE